EVVAETLRRTTLAHVQVGDRVNLERALAAGSRMGGHFVQGHVDGIGRIAALQDLAFGKLLRLSLAEPLLAFVVEKGSIAVDGISLTVASVDSKFVDIAVIPHTLQATTLHSKKQGDAVNIEVDILAKYVKKFMIPSMSAEGLTLEKLSQYGYLENHD
ncbi:MAG: riboflavin synthase, partial [candidate division KSB1 bacterium]|nr:riboflavin synthase [candidate division KSB1 bacterium]